MGLEMLPPPVVEESAPEEIDARVDVRVLSEDEVAQIAPVFAENGATMPNPATSCFVGAVEDGKVIGFLCLQLQLHAEPMWIADGSSAIFPRLIGVAEQTIKDRVGSADVFLFAPAGRVARLAQLQGMQVEPWVVLSKRIEREPKPRVMAANSVSEPAEPAERIPVEEMMEGAD